MDVIQRIQFNKIFVKVSYSHEIRCHIAVVFNDVKLSLIFQK